jgi:hypothetical protein
MAGGFWRQDLYSNIPVGISPADSRFRPFVFVAGASRVARAAPVHITKQQRAAFTTDGKSYDGRRKIRSSMWADGSAAALPFFLVGDPFAPLSTTPFRKYRFRAIRNSNP